VTVGVGVRVAVGVADGTAVLVGRGVDEAVAVAVAAAVAEGASVGASQAVGEGAGCAATGPQAAVAAKTRERIPRTGNLRLTPPPLMPDCTVL
jgi:hypothetical protein